MCEQLLGAAAALGAEARLDLLAFGEWVVQRGFTHIVDGPNVGYRNQNFDGGRFSHMQPSWQRLPRRPEGTGWTLCVIPRWAAYSSFQGYKTQKSKHAYMTHIPQHPRPVRIPTAYPSPVGVGARAIAVRVRPCEWSISNSSGVFR